MKANAPRVPVGRNAQFRIRHCNSSELSAGSNISYLAYLSREEMGRVYKWPTITW